MSEDRDLKINSYLSLNLIKMLYKSVIAFNTVIFEISIENPWKFLLFIKKLPSSAADKILWASSKIIILFLISFS